MVARPHVLRHPPTYACAFHCLSPPRGLSSGLIAASCILVVLQAIVIATLGLRTLGPLVSDVIQLALGLICILACTAAFRRLRGIAQYAWRLLAVAFLVWAVAQALAVYIDVSGDHSPDSLSGILLFSPSFRLGC